MIISPVEITLKSKDARNVMLAILHVLTGAFLLYAGFGIYKSHPYYISFLSLNTIEVMNYLVAVLIAILVLDAIVKLIRHEKFPRTDLLVVYFYILHLVNSLFSRKHPIPKPEGRTKVALLYILLKFFYIPIMLNIGIGNLSAVSADVSMINAGTLTLNFDTVYPMIITTLFMVDTLVFSFGYIFAAKWLKSEVISVEPTMLGWVAALITYPPFNGTTGMLLPMVSGGAGLLVLSQNPAAFRIIQILILICYAIFVAASIALGPKASNLTSRGVVQYGPYALVRHPAYLVKILAWFLSGLIFASSWTYFLAMMGFAVIYYIRAWTEERHLSSTDPDYDEYKKKVKWMFVPKII